MKANPVLHVELEQRLMDSGAALVRLWILRRNGANTADAWALYYPTHPSRGRFVRVAQSGILERRKSRSGVMTSSVASVIAWVPAHREDEIEGDA
jgi:hypothetical protein